MVVECVLIRCFEMRLKMIFLGDIEFLFFLFFFFFCLECHKHMWTRLMQGFHPLQNINSIFRIKTMKYIAVVENSGPLSLMSFWVDKGNSPGFYISVTLLTLQWVAIKEKQNTVSLFYFRDNTWPPWYWLGVRHAVVCVLACFTVDCM